MKISKSDSDIQKQLKQISRAGSVAKKVKIVLKGSEEVAKESAKLLGRPSKALIAFANAMKKLNML